MINLLFQTYGQPQTMDTKYFCGEMFQDCHVLCTGKTSGLQIILKNIPILTLQNCNTCSYFLLHNQLVL